VLLDVRHFPHHLGHLSIDTGAVVEEHRSARVSDSVPALHELGEFSDMLVRAAN
jgi:hypothetical protein